MRFLSNMNIGKRLALGFMLILAMTVGITGFSVWRMSQLATATRAMDVPLLKQRLIADWNTQIFGAIRRTAAIAKSSDPALAAYFKDDAATTTGKSTELVKQIEPLLTEQGELALFQKISDARKVYRSATNAAMKAKADGDQTLAAKILDENFTPAAKVFQSLLDDLMVMQNTEIVAYGKSIQNNQALTVNLILILAACAVLSGGFFCWFPARSIVGPIRAAVGVAETVAAGDLSNHIDATGRGETGSLLRALRHMNDSLTAIVTEVRSGTDTMATASAEISAGNIDLSGRTEQQASALEETAASMEELTTTVRNNADNARQANTLSIAASDVAVQGGAVVSQVIDTMGAINAASRKIVDIIAVIDGIAFQTNILALNAAVEAARAGEQGRGFAVVASEVRTLAQRSAAAAKEIKELIGASVEQVEAGTKLVDRAGATMEEVVTSIRRVTDIMGEITTASAEQSGGIEQVNVAIGQMDEATQQNAALVEKSAAAAASMQEHAAKLADVVSVFKLDQSVAARVVAVRPVAATVKKPVAKLVLPVTHVEPTVASVKLGPAKRATAATTDDWEEF